MHYFKLFLLTGNLVICAQLLIAQQVYQAGDYGSPGDAYLYNRFAPGGFSNEAITATGANVTWDLSTNTSLNTHINRIVEPGEGINQFNFLTVCSLSGLSTFDCLAVWNSTEQAVELQDSLLLLDFTLYDLQRYQAKVSTLLLENFIGFTVDLNNLATQAVIVYQVPDTIMHFPVHYGDAWTSQTRYGLDLNPAGQNILYNAIQYRTTTIDAWGTLETPYDTFENVLRLRSDILRLDTIIQDNTDTIIIVADQVEYMWLDTNYTLPIMTANGILGPNDSIIINALEYIYEATCPAPTWTVDLGGDVFYLDSSGSVTIDFTILNPNANMYNWDFGDGEFGISEEGVSHTYSSPGEYAAVVFGCMTNCLPLNSCSFQILDFEILDTPTSVASADGSDLGIRIYPNPVRETLNLFLPEETAIQNFRIVDVNGREVQAGNISTGASSLNLNGLPGGIYAIQFWSTSPAHQMAVIRFIHDPQ